MTDFVGRRIGGVRPRLFLTRSVLTSLLLGGYLLLLGGSASAGGDPWRELRRPLHLPSVTADRRCPVTASRELSPAFAPGSGNGPVYPLGEGRLGFLYPVRRSQGWYPSKWSGQKVLWVAPRSFEGPVLVRGRRLDGRYLLRFGDRRRPVAELRMVFGSDDLGEGGWLTIGTYTRVRAEGCYAWQIDGLGFSEVVVFRAVRFR